MKIVAVDNFDRDMYDDALVCENVSHKKHAELMCKALNDYWNDDNHDYFYEVVDDDYALKKYYH
jgi:hypothetical protein